MSPSLHGLKRARLPRALRAALLGAALVGGCAGDGTEDMLPELSGEPGPADAPAPAPPPDAGAPADASNASTTFQLPQPDASTTPARAPGLAIFTYHAWQDELLVVLHEPGCYLARSIPGRCAECATKVTVEEVDNCLAPASTLRARIPGATGLVVTNPLRNTAVGDEALCDSERALARRLWLSEGSFATAERRGYAPWFRERADDRLATTDWVACAEAAPRLREAFYPWSR